MRRASVVFTCLALVLAFGLSPSAGAAPASRSPQQPAWLASGPPMQCVDVQRQAPGSSTHGQAILVDTLCVGTDGNTKISGCCERRSDFCESLCTYGIRRFTCVEVQNGCSSYCGCHQPY